jgi:hypothetical protein
MIVNDQEALIEFLNCQKCLDTLHFESIKDFFDARFGVIKPQFKLKELAMINLTLMDFWQSINFLKQMENSVEHLDLRGHIHEQVCVYILQNFSKITHMRIDCECLPRSILFYSKMMINKSIRELSIVGCMRSHKPLLRFLSKFPNTRQLLMSGEYYTRNM